MARTVVWFSAGAASAIAARLALNSDPRAALVYMEPGSEHPDNQRFIADVERWLGVDVIKLRSERYRDTWQVWQERRYLNGPAGALCTYELKKRLREAYQDEDDVQVFGYTVEERLRAERFRGNNPEITLWTPLIEQGLRKADCLALLERAGIALPAMYRMGYRNNNCIGCVKGGRGYWNKIRRDFPETFARMAALEREIGRSCINGVFLDVLDPRAGNHDEEPNIDCSLLCAASVDDVLKRATPPEDHQP